MSSPYLVPDPAVTDDLLPPPSVAVPAAPRIPAHVAKHLAAGTSTLGASVLIERGAGFLGNVLAARFAGAAVFGAYALGISTANNISTYAAGGIGATATRFSGKYSYESGAYATFARVLTVVSVVSAFVAVTALWFGAAPIAVLLRKPSIVHLLRWASLSAAGMILLESARGFFVGQRRLAALALLSVLVGVGMVSVLPAVAATHHPTEMIVAQGAITVSAVAICLVLRRRLSLLAPKSENASIRFGRMLRDVWGFGFIQLSGLLSANLAGWWLTALVARNDTSLVQMGFFAIASQLRNLTGIVPGLLTESSYAVMASESSDDARMPDCVMALCTFASTCVSFVFSSIVVVVVPWALAMLYGQRYAGAAVAAAVGMSVAVIQMGNSPPSARMSVVSVRWVAAGNTVWAIFVAVFGTLFLLHGGGAAKAMAVFFAGHVLLASFVLSVLRRYNHLPSGMISLFVISTLGVAALDALSLLRYRYASVTLPVTAAMALVFVVCGFSLYWLGKKHGWLPSLDSARRVLSSAPAKLQAVLRAVRWRNAHDS